VALKCLIDSAATVRDSSPNAARQSSQHIRSTNRNAQRAFTPSDLGEDFTFGFDLREYGQVPAPLTG